MFGNKLNCNSLRKAVSTVKRKLYKPSQYSYKCGRYRFLQCVYTHNKTKRHFKILLNFFLRRQTSKNLTFNLMSIYSYN